MTRRARSSAAARVERGLAYLALAAIVTFFLLPVLWMAITSVQPYALLTAVPPRVSFAAATGQNYADLLGDPKFRRAVTATVVTSVLSTALALLVAIPAGYATGRLRFAGRAVYLFSILTVQIGPAVAFLIPLFLMMQRFGLIDTYPGLILVFVLFVAPVAVWLLRGFFAVLPPGLERAARMDGASRWRAFYQILLPLGTGGIWAVVLLIFISVWGDLLIPLVLSFSRVVTLTVVASGFSGEQNINYGGASAVAVLSALPAVILALAFRRHLIKGVTEGAVKQ